MRWVHLTIIILFAAAMLVFALQNLASVTVSFLGVSIGLPLAILVFVASPDMVLASAVTDTLAGVADASRSNKPTPVHDAARRCYSGHAVDALLHL